MKLEKIKFNNHEIFNDLEIDFKDNNGKILDTIVVIGENGSGKTTLLKCIYDSFDIDERSYEEIGDNKVELTPALYTATVKLENNEIGILSPDIVFELGDNPTDPKVVYMPTEINFEKINKVDNTLNFTPYFQNIVDQNMTQNIPSFIATKINKEIFKNRNKTIGEVIDKVCDDINSIFSIMNLDIKLIGLSETSDTKPIFRNSLGKEFDITGLSSGEKQLFLRALSLKFLEVNNSIILIDEPEISLHPEWQRKIIDVYKSIGNNNQLIIATHSPHVIGNITSNELRVMAKDENGIKLVDNDELSETYGKSIGDILSTTMKLDSLRNDDITDKLNKIYDLLNRNLYDTEEFKNLFNYLRTYLGDLDKDIMRIRLDVSVRNKKNAKG
ncbi:AAA family ATPase [Clostridium beijerinckii]|uniref:ATP-binding protein involved in virulence n=1 Tax=Clostridium beijerinckii TaxID=1520 RepID=A0AAE5LQ86_CLOBE|nr:ATP-binding protein [Clostridium beijerinckii]NSB14603.1 putative ATP-binding protein involved in virulence [Clostridium beijerinckii]OOM34508.1 glutamine ABC transporter ATP-binding protein [Clostridium beijerinckii]